MMRCGWVALVLALLLGPVASARADAGIPAPVAEALGITIVIGGLALSLAAILAGRWLARRLRSQEERRQDELGPGNYPSSGL
jgi:hypothetical protein